MKPNKFLQKVKDFFTVRTTLIVIICILVLIIILQSFHVFGGHRRPRDFGSYRSDSVSSNSRHTGFPGMMGGGFGPNGR